MERTAPPIDAGQLRGHVDLSVLEFLPGVPAHLAATLRTENSCKPDPQKYKGRKTRLDEVETEEEASEYLKGIQRRYEEGKTTRLP